MIWIYRVFYSMALFLLTPYLWFSTSPYARWRRLHRHDLKNLRPSSEKSYWFHAASGEIEYCKSIIRQLKQQNPKARIVVTYSSPSAERLFENIREYVTEFIALPWDTIANTQKLIQLINPRILVFSRTDLWPELIYQIKQNHIPVGVVSLTLPPQKSLSFFKISLLQQMDFISCLNEHEKDKLSILLDSPQISSDGDTRFDQVFYRLSQPSRLDIATEAPILVCGSTWPEDEEVLLACFQQLVQSGIKIILSPHEVQTSNIARLQHLVLKMNLSVDVLSQCDLKKSFDFKSDILIIDRIGYLADCYRQANFAFIGGSFKSKIHSVMEALACGVPVLTGPFYENNPEAVKYQNKFVFTVKNSKDFLKRLQLLRADNLNSQIKIEMKKNLNASERALNTILNFANSSVKI